MRIRAAFSALLLSAGLLGQVRTLKQDPSLDNLHHPAGTPTAPLGTFGNLRKSGEGKRAMVLIPGLGFGDGIWAEFMDHYKADYTMYAVTLPGFAGTAPLPMPPDGSRFLEIPWTKSAIQAIEGLMEKERIQKVTLVAHWALAPQIALRLALDHPDRVEAVVLIGGVLKSYFDITPGMLNWSLEKRTQWVDAFGEKWFKTVTRKTWDDNNFMSYDYAINPRRGLYLWREAQSPSLAVWIRYLLEFYTFDQTSELKNLKVPTLVVQPGFDDPAFYVEPGANYMRNFCIGSWQGTTGMNERLQFATIPQSRLFIMYDQPEALFKTVDGFLGVKKP